jgi:ATP-binding cassette subfamily C protein CydC
LGEYGAAISGGQARRIALARLLLKPRRVLLLDEPFAGLDAPTRAQLWQNVREHQQQNLLIVVSHHQWDMGLCDSISLPETQL